MNTLQEVFTTAYLGLQAQGFQRSVGETSNGVPVCVYRAPNGFKCAIGQCIPDEVYQPEMDDKLISVQGLQDGYGLFPNVNEQRLFDLQNIHDSAEDSKEMKEAFILFAQTHNLEIPT